MSNNIKAKAKIVMNEFREHLSVDFEKNKNFIKRINLPLSKKTINLMCGYITRTIKKQIKEEEKTNLNKEKTKTPIKKSKDTKIHA